MAKKKKGLGVAGLIVLLVAVLLGGVLFVGAVSGWFEDDFNVVLDAEYLGTFEGFNDITAEEYEELARNQRSFVVLVDQGGCTTADKLRGFVKDWATDAGVKVQRIMFSEIKETSLHDSVKYYPAVAIISRGKVVGFLRADSDEDADKYNDFEAFKGWIEKYL